MVNQHRDIDVVILCGGLGKRLRNVVSDRPKALAKVNNRPFLDLLVTHLASYGFKRFILCTGYMGGKIKSYFKNSSISSEILYSQEKKPLGTGGALKKAEPLVKSKIFLAINGDSFCPIDFGKFINFHLAKRSLVSVASTKMKQSKNIGKIAFDRNKRIIKFSEKSASRNTKYSNVGIYLMKKHIFSLMDARKNFSLEYDFFPSIIGHGLYAYTTKENLIDIGTPKEYRRAQKLFFT